MHFDVIIYVLVIDFLAILSPGPDFFMVLKNAMTVSPKAGLYTTLGIATGSSIVFTFGLLGLGAIVVSSKWLFLVIKILGACYLVYIALKSILAVPKIEEPQLVYKTRSNIPTSAYFKMGLICNLTNPKAFMFIVAVSTYAIAHGGDHVLDVIAIIIGSGVATLCWFSAVSFIFGNFTVRKIFYQKQRIINLIFAAILFYVAIKIVTM